MTKIINIDLIPRHPENPRNDDDMQRAFTQAQLVIYRERDTKRLGPPILLYETLTKIAAEIENLSIEWHKFNTERHNKKSPRDSVTSYLEPDQ